MNRTIYVNNIEPARLSLRHPLGIDLDLNVTFMQQTGAPYEPTYPQLVLMPRSQGGFFPFDMTVTDVVNGIANVEVPGSALVDFNGYNIELYMRRENDIPENPPVPTFLAARGKLLTEGSAYEKSSLAETILPTVVGAMGPPGPPGTPGGPPGDPGQRGSIWFTGTGAPTVTEGVQAADMYLDEATGDVYRYDGAVWTRGTF